MWKKIFHQSLQKLLKNETIPLIILIFYKIFTFMQNHLSVSRKKNFIFSNFFLSDFRPEIFEEIYIGKLPSVLLLFRDSVRVDPSPVTGRKTYGFRLDIQLYVGYIGYPNRISKSHIQIVYRISKSHIQIVYRISKSHIQILYPNRISKSYIQILYPKRIPKSYIQILYPKILYPISKQGP